MSQLTELVSLQHPTSSAAHTELLSPPPTATIAHEDEDAQQEEEEEKETQKKEEAAAGMLCDLFGKISTQPSISIYVHEPSSYVTSRLTQDQRPAAHVAHVCVHSQLTTIGLVGSSVRQFRPLVGNNEQHFSTARTRTRVGHSGNSTTTRACYLYTATTAPERLQKLQTTVQVRSDHHESTVH
jgi:hypothetical protein